MLEAAELEVQQQLAPEELLDLLQALHQTYIQHGLALLDLLHLPLAVLAVSLAGQQSYTGILEATPLGNQTRANSTTGGPQVLAGAPSRSIAISDNGSYVVVWAGEGTGEATGQTGISEETRTDWERSEVRVVDSGAASGATRPPPWTGTIPKPMLSSSGS